MKRGHDDGKMETMGEENKKGDFCPLFRLPRPACSGLAAQGIGAFPVGETGFAMVASI